MKICCFRRKLKFSHFPFQFYWAFLLTISALQGIPSFSSMRVVAAILLLFFIFWFPIYWFFFFFWLHCCMQLSTLPSFQYVAQKIIIIIYKRFCIQSCCQTVPNWIYCSWKTFIANFTFFPPKLCLNNLSEVLRTC